MHTYTPNQCPYQVSTFYTLWNPRNNLDKILKLMVTMTRSKVKSRPHHDVAHLKPLTNAPSTSYTLQFLRYSPDKLFPATHPPVRTPIWIPWVKTIQWGKNCIHSKLYSLRHKIATALNIKSIILFLTSFKPIVSTCTL